MTRLSGVCGERIRRRADVLMVGKDRYKSKPSSRVRKTLLVGYFKGTSECFCVNAERGGSLLYTPYLSLWEKVRKEMNEVELLYVYSYSV